MPVYDDNGNMTDDRVGRLGREMGQKVDELLSVLFVEGTTIVEARALTGYLEGEIRYAATLNFMLHQMRDTVAVEVHGKYPACLDKRCKHKRECANHTTAGDFRSEDGDTPNLVKMANGWKCSREPEGIGRGAVLTDGTCIRESMDASLHDLSYGGDSNE